MTNDKKLAVQEQHIAKLESEIQRLKQENEFLKQVIPTGADVPPVKEVYVRFQKALVDALVLKKQYETANETIKILRKNYEMEMNELLSRLRGDVARAESRRSGTNLRQSDDKF